MLGSRGTFVWSMSTKMFERESGWSDGVLDICSCWVAKGSGLWSKGGGVLEGSWSGIRDEVEFLGFLKIKCVS